MIFLHILIIKIENNNVHFNDHQKGFLLKQGRIHDTKSCRGLGRSGNLEGRGSGGCRIGLYTTASVACDWAEAVMKNRSQSAKNAKNTKVGPADRPTDRPTNTVAYSVA